MARVTVEDCVLKIPNRFRLVMLAAQRARDLSVGSPLTVERDDDKNPVVALREIADGTVGVDDLEEALVTGLQKHVVNEESEEDTTELLAMEEELAATAGTGLMADNVSEEELAVEELVEAEGDAPTATEGDAPTATEGDAPTATEGDTPTATEGDTPTATDGDVTADPDPNVEAVAALFTDDPAAMAGDDSETNSDAASDTATEES